MMSYSFAFNGKNHSIWAFQFQIFVKGKNLGGHVDGTNSAPNKENQLNEYTVWEVKDAHVMAWIIGSVDPHIVLNLRPMARCGLISRRFIARIILLEGSSWNMKLPYFNKIVSQFLNFILSS